MGADTKKTSIVPPLPAPTETETLSLGTPTELATDVSKPGDENSSYSLPEDGTPVTIRTRGHRANKSQTSLLIEYFEGGKVATGSVDQRKPSVRVRLTPSSKERKGESERGHIKITETKSRKASLSRRAAASSTQARSDLDPAHSALGGDLEDAKSLSSYASATEESNVSRNPIDIEIDRSGHVRRRRPASPLIPAADASKVSYQPGSDISAIPTDSFLDGSGPTGSTFKMSEGKYSRSRSPSRSRVGDVLGAAAAGLAAAAVADKIKSKSRNESREHDRDRVSVSKTRDKEKERKHRSSKSRTSSLSKEEKYADGAKSPRRKSSRGHSESILSGADSSVVSSAFSGSHRTYDQQSIRSGASKASSINNPKLLETVEDAIRRLILPELDALKKEQSKQKERRSSATSSSTISRDEFTREQRRSSAGPGNADTTLRGSIGSKDRRDREARHDFDESPSVSGTGHESVEEIHHTNDTPSHDHNHLMAAAAGAGLAGAAALAMHEAMKSPSEDKRSRRRRRAEMRGRGSDYVPEDYEEDLVVPAPPMPLMASEFDHNPSEMTRASILSAESDAHSATEELTPANDGSRSQLSAESSPTPTKGPTLAALGAQHANISHGDLRALPRKEIGEFAEDDLYDRGYDPRAEAVRQDELDDDEYDERDDYAPSANYDFYNPPQDVPPPLRYVPYQPERRGLSPIPSVSGFTEGGSEINRNSDIAQESEISSPGKAPRHDRYAHSPSSIPSNIMNREFDDESGFRSPGLEYRNTMSTESSELGGGTRGQAVRAALGANPDFVHPLGVESNVASLVDGSMLDGSLLTAESSDLPPWKPTNPPESVGSKAEPDYHRGGMPLKVSARGFSEEYDVNEFGQKVPIHPARYQQSPTTSEAAITGAAVTAAAAALKAHRGQQHPVGHVLDDQFEPAGVQRNKSFKERAMNGQHPGPEPKYSFDRLTEDQDNQPRMGFNAVPHPNDMVPAAEWQEDVETNPSLNGDEGFTVKQHYDEYDDELHPGDETPTRSTPVPRQPENYEEQHHDQVDERYDSPISASQEKSEGLGLTEAAGAAALGAAAAMAAREMHSRQPSQDREEDWYRTSDDRKRDTLVTNPYEGTSPIVNLPGLGVGDPAAYAHDDEFHDDYRSSPLEHKDEGYISQGPNKSPDVQKGKGVDFSIPPAVGGTAGIEDPFFTPAHQKHLSGLSQGMGSPLYDAATGTGMDRIESKDIIALMQHVSESRILAESSSESTVLTSDTADGARRST